MKKIFLLVCFALMFIELAEATSIGISNADFNFRNMQRGGYAERTVLLSTDSERVLEAHAESLGNTSGWISFDPSQAKFNLSKGNPYQLKIKLDLPEDIENGNYSGLVRFVADREFVQLGNENVVKTAIIAIVHIEVGGPAKVNCTLSSSDISSSEEGIPFEIIAEIRNDGNTKITPQIKVDIKDSRHELFAYEFEREIGVGKSVGIKEVVSHNLSSGIYLALVSAEMCGSEVIEFSVLEKGSLAGRGELSKLEVLPEAKQDEWIPIVALFENTGETVVNAKLVVDVYHNGVLDQTVETNEAYVSGGQSKEFVAYYIPDEGGTYETVARVYYSGRFSGYKRSSFVVNNSQSSFVYAAIIGIIIMLGLIIIKRKQHKKERFS